MPIPAPPTPIQAQIIGRSANDIINSALRLIKALATGEIPTATESADALLILNDMVDSWNADRLMIYTISRNVFDLVSGQQTYTCGDGGNFNMQRPASIQTYTVISLQNPAQPLELPLDVYTDVAWAGVPVKNIQSSLPTAVYDDGGFPFRNISYWCVPNVGSLQAGIYSWQAVNRFLDLTTKYSFPPAYLKALRYNLAVDLAPEFGATVPDAVASQALQTKAAIKSINAPLVGLRCDPAVTNNGSLVYNWISDTWVRIDG
jgi:hypothetical protein